MDVTEWEEKTDKDGILELPERISISLRFVDSGGNRKEEEVEKSGILFKTSLILPAGEI